jgi:drug/metabolite transporter (DMT)-like permease
LFNGVPLLLLLWRSGGLKAAKLFNHWPLILLRSLLTTAVLFGAFTAFSLLPLAEAYSLFFAAPLVTTALSVPVLGEKVGWRRWTAVLVGFVGVLIVLRPGVASVGTGHMAALMVAVCFALSLILVRKAGTGVTTVAVGVWLYVFQVVATALVVVPDFVPMAISDILAVGLAGIFIGTANLMLISANRTIPPVLVSLFHYTQLVWGIVFGVTLFGDYPDGLMLLGAAIIVASGAFIAWRETRL